MASNAYRLALSIGIAGVAFIALGVILGWAVLPLVVKNKIADIIALKNNSEAWSRWENPPVPIYFVAYIFHVNNPDDIVKGALPNVSEKGPYVYREKRVKTILALNEGISSVVYQQKLLFDFDREASGNNSEDDVVTVANIPALALAQVVSNLRGINSFIHLVNTAIHKIWPTENSNPLFTTTKVKDYLFGRIPMLCNQEVSLGNMDTKILCESMKIINPRAMFFDDGGKGIHTYSLFRYKNDSEDGTYEIDLGIKDVTQIGNIITWNHVTKLSHWKADECNKILGTDGSLMRPFLSMDNVKSLHVYNTDICRSIELNRDRNVEHKGISGIRYATDEKVFASVLKNPKNYCYCPQSIRGITHFGGCLKSGVIELSSCQGLPVVISLPHFLMSDTSYQRIKGLKPDKEKHQAFIVLEPYTGYPLLASSRFQVNIFLQSISEVSVMKSLPNVLLPVVWIEEKMELTDDLMDEIDSQLIRTMKIANAMRWFVVGFGITLSLASCIYYLVKIRTKSRNFNRN